MGGQANRDVAACHLFQLFRASTGGACWGKILGYFVCPSWPVSHDADHRANHVARAYEPQVRRPSTTGKTELRKDPPRECKCRPPSSNGTGDAACSPGGSSQGGPDDLAGGGLQPLYASDRHFCEKRGVGRGPFAPSEGGRETKRRPGHSRKRAEVTGHHRTSVTVRWGYCTAERPDPWDRRGGRGFVGKGARGRRRSRDIEPQKRSGVEGG